MTDALIALDDVTLGYDGHPAVHHLTGRFLAGSMTAIVGPNGSGKSTLLKGIVGLLPTLGGTIRRMDRDFAYLPQRADAHLKAIHTAANKVDILLWSDYFRILTGFVRYEYLLW